MFFDTVVRDLRFGVRLLTRNPMFAGLAIITLALGIGAAVWCSWGLVCSV
jgi:hypothetical protein